MSKAKTKNWAAVFAEWDAEAEALKETEGVDSRAYREAAAFARSAERRMEAQQEAEAERARFDSMTPREIARAVVDRMDGGR